MWKKTISFLVWCHVKVQLKRSHLNGRTFFSSVSSFFLPGSEWSYGFSWFLNLKWFPTSYWHHDSLVSCFCSSCSPQRLVHVLVEDHKTEENYMYKNHDNRKSHEKYQPWESGKPGIRESHRARETKRTWEPLESYLWRITKPRRTTCTRTTITGRAMRNTNHENQENQA